jgi:hypothetical protein
MVPSRTASAALHLMNTSAGQFGTSTSDYSLTPDNTAIVGTLFQLHGVVVG